MLECIEGMSVSKTNQDPTFKFLVDLKASGKKRETGWKWIHVFQFYITVSLIWAV